MATASGRRAGRRRCSSSGARCKGAPGGAPGSGGYARGNPRPAAPARPARATGRGRSAGGGRTARPAPRPAPRPRRSSCGRALEEIEGAGRRRAQRIQQATAQAEPGAGGWQVHGGSPLRKRPAGAGAPSRPGTSGVAAAAAFAALAFAGLLLRVGLVLARVVGLALGLVDVAVLVGIHAREVLGLVGMRGQELGL